MAAKATLKQAGSSTGRQIMVLLRKLSLTQLSSMEEAGLWGGELPITESSKAELGKGAWTIWVPSFFPSLILMILFFKKAVLNCLNQAKWENSHDNRIFKILVFLCLAFSESCKVGYLLLHITWQNSVNTWGGWSCWENNIMHGNYNYSFRAPLSRFHASRLMHSCLLLCGQCTATVNGPSEVILCFHSIFLSSPWMRTCPNIGYRHHILDINIWFTWENFTKLKNI